MNLLVESGFIERGREGGVVLDGMEERM